MQGRGRRLTGAVLALSALLGAAVLSGQGTTMVSGVGWVLDAAGVRFDRPVGIGTTPVAGVPLTIDGGTQTTAVQPLIIRQTWNNAATTFPGVQIVITDTASGANSTAFRIYGGAAGKESKFVVNKNGGVTAASTIVAQSSIYAGSTGALGWTGRSRFTSTAAGTVKVWASDGTTPADVYAGVFYGSAAGLTGIMDGALTWDETTASGNITLLAASKKYQFVDCDGSDRDVTLPAGSSGLWFMIGNVGAANTITVKDAGGTPVTTVAVGERKSVLYTTTWRVL
ncbi:MAG: hypothetical protein KBA95_01810 [Acidobacteria bacterium]|nr:hypothetical protein [Acidobacteriota bacterium]